MIPLRDNVPSRGWPLVNVLLIAANLWVFAKELAMGPRLEAFIGAWGLIPARVGGEGALLTFLSSMFLHGGWMHVIGNMWSLWIFGDNVEDRLGHFPFLLFYLACGVAAGAFQVMVSPASRVPMVGASGAIAGVMGAYFLMYPSARVTTLVPFFFLYTVDVPAFIFLGVWLWTQFEAGSTAVLRGAAGAGGVAWWAHVGGFVGGMLLAFPFLGRRPTRRR